MGPSALLQEARGLRGIKGLQGPSPKTLKDYIDLLIQYVLRSPGPPDTPSGPSLHGLHVNPSNFLLGMLFLICPIRPKLYKKPLHHAAPHFGPRVLDCEVLSCLTSCSYFVSSDKISLKNAFLTTFERPFKML